MADRADREKDALALIAGKRYSDALHALLGLYGAELRGYLWGTFGDSAEGDDIFQELSLALWRALERYQGGASLRTFCFSIAHHLVAKRIRRRSRRRNERLDTDRERALPARSLTSAQDGALRDQLVADAQQRLDPSEREVLILRAERGFSYAEVAQVLGVTEAAARKRYERSKERLKALLEPVSEQLG